jgi:hypothetical protein
MRLLRTNILTSILLTVHVFTTSVSALPSSFVSFYPNEIGGYTITVGLGFTVNSCNAVYDAFASSEERSAGIAQAVSGHVYSLLTAQINSVLVARGGGLYTSVHQTSTGIKEAFGVFANHWVAPWTQRHLVEFAAYQVAGKLGIHHKRVFDYDLGYGSKRSATQKEELMPAVTPDENDSELQHLREFLDAHHEHFSALGMSGAPWLEQTSRKDRRPSRLMPRSTCSNDARWQKCINWNVNPTNYYGHTDFSC